MKDVVALAPPIEKYTVTNGPMQVEMRSAPTRLSELAVGMIHFPDGGRSEPWELPYEEAFYVVDGLLELHFGNSSVTVQPGEVVTLTRGTTVVYEGIPGTRAFYALVPADWYKKSSGGGEESV